MLRDITYKLHLMNPAACTWLCLVSEGNQEILQVTIPRFLFMPAYKMLSFVLQIRLNIRLNKMECDL